MSSRGSVDIELRRVNLHSPFITFVVTDSGAATSAVLSRAVGNDPLQLPSAFDTEPAPQRHSLWNVLLIKEPVPARPSTFPSPWPAEGPPR